VEFNQVLGIVPDMVAAGINPHLFTSGHPARSICVTRRLLSLTWIIHEPSRRDFSVQQKGDESPEKSAYVDHCGLEALEIALPLFITETHSHE
jgi:hypothetical protein